MIILLCWAHHLFFLIFPFFWHRKKCSENVCRWCCDHLGFVKFIEWQVEVVLVFHDSVLGKSQSLPICKHSALEDLPQGLEFWEFPSQQFLSRLSTRPAPHPTNARALLLPNQLTPDPSYTTSVRQFLFTMTIWQTFSPKSSILFWSFIS